MADKCVVRNAQYRRGGLNKRERHNERKNADYMNDDIVKDRAELNVHFKHCEGYEKTFDELVANGVVSTRGLGKDPNIVDELVFDVNTGYFENHGGYDYAKSFFAEAYRLAVKEIGGEEYVLSAVMHADERNRALSEQLGRDVYHYHLHVTYVPVVDKEIYYKKNNKNPELAGKLKEVIKQVSHSKKWPRFKGENGRWVNAYSLLQDRFFEHMKEAGFDDFERGERGATAEHLSVLEYKTKQEQKRAAALDKAIGCKEQTAAALDEKTSKKQKRLEHLDEQITVKGKAAATVTEIDALGKPALLGGFTLTADEIAKLKTLAKKSVTADKKVVDMHRKLKAAERELGELQTQLAQVKKSSPSIKDRITWFDKFTAAMKRAPKRLMAVIEDILREPPERAEPQRTVQKRAAPERKKNHGMER